MLRSPVALCCLGLLTCVAGAQEPVRGAQDQVAFARARAVADPEERLQALKEFAQTYPGTTLAQRAEALELDTLVQFFPDRTSEIHALAAGEVAQAAPGFERWSEQARLADLLADAGTAGADLSDAKPWAEQAVAAMTEESYRRQMMALQTKYKLEPVPARELRHNFVRNRATFLAALANVDLREKDTEGAERALTEAARLDPLSSEVSSLRGQLALLRHQDREALEDFERAEAEGDLREPWRTEMLRLYKAAKQGDEAGLNDEVDALYARLFPPPYALPPRKLPAGGHTVLLELFTGSGCEPCVAPDLAVESLLGSYSRQDLVILELDEHIPRPDPLASPDTLNRAASYGVSTTPQAFLDGEELPVAGASRADVENVVIGFADEIENRAAEPTGVQLALSASRDEAGVVSAKAAVSRTALPAAAQPGGAAPRASGPTPLTIRFALVEDHVRYSGENGIRFHRMVVRALARSAGLAASAATGMGEATFHPEEISRRQAAYLSAFEKTNDRFGEVQFLTKDIPLAADHLAVAAWVENATTHEVLQAAFVPVPAT